MIVGEVYPTRPAIALFRKFLIRADDTNAMVGKVVMHFRYVHFFHVTGDAILRIRRARLGGMRRALLLASCYMTAGTDAIIG
jgi:hypothetical protein